MYFVISLSYKKNNAVILLLKSLSSLERSSSSYSVFQIILNITVHCVFIYSFISSQSTVVCGPKLGNGKVWLLIYCTVPPLWHTELMGMIPFWIPLGTELKNGIVCLKYSNYRVLIDHRFGCVQSLPLVALTGSVLMAVSGFGLVLAQRSFS